MRQSPTAKRGRGRSGGRRPYSNPANRSYDSSGPDVKIRGTASHIYEKYQTLARDASASGDRIAAENYLQHAEHYFRILNANNANQNQNQNPAPNQQQGQPEQQPQPGYHADGGANGRGRGNGQRMAAEAENEQEDDAGGVIRTLSRSDDSRAVEPLASGPTSFESGPDTEAPQQPEPAHVAPQQPEPAHAAPQQPEPAHAAPEPKPETAGQGGDAKPEGLGRKKSAKEKSDAATAT